MKNRIRSRPGARPSETILAARCSLTGCSDHPPGADRCACPGLIAGPQLDEYRELCRVRLEHVVEVREPLVLVSQVQRSGGTLLSQLFDGHPECHAHPSEIYIGHPRKWDWPPLDLAAPETLVRRPLRDAGRPAPARGVREAQGGAARARPRRLPVRLPPAPAAGDLRALGRLAGRSRPSATCSTATSPRTSTPGSTTRTSTRGRSGRSPASLRCSASSPATPSASSPRIRTGR